MTPEASRRPDANDVVRYGAKAAGLMALPPAWVPPFVVLEARRPASFVRSPDSLDEIQRLLRSRPDVSSTGNLYVRSSAPVETLDQRGRLVSYECAATPEAVADAVARIASHAAAVGVTQLAILLQRRVEAHSLGHLSNERRIHKSEHNWLFEEHWPVVRSVQIRPKAVSPDIDTPLVAHSFDEPPERTIEPLASMLTIPDERYHLEWVSDSDALWIVQCDVEPRAVNSKPCSAWIGRRVAEQEAEERYSVILSAAELDSAQWRKARHVRMFHELGFPHGDVFLLADSKLVRGLAEGRTDEALERDLDVLSRWPVVVRTDVASTDSGLLLPHSPALHRTADVVGFMQGTARAFSEDAAAGRLAFLLHRFVAAEVGAFAYARPDVSRVRVDATWGVPDSLLFHPHDTFDVNLNDPDRVRSQIRCKSAFVDVDEEGNWAEREAGWNWDWKSSMTPEQVRAVARMAHLVARRENQQIQMMFFVGVHRATGHPDVLPWFVQNSETDDLDERSIWDAECHRIERTVRTPEDLDLIVRDLGAHTVAADDLLIVLRPAAALLREEAFLQAVGAVARSWSLPVALEGSILSHAFYVLRRSGVRVRERRAPSVPRSSELPLNKLVRDRVPELVLAKSEDVTVMQIGGEELLQLLTLKAVEEAAELAFGSGEDAILDELADLLEVVRSVAKQLDLSLGQVAQLADEKRSARGGFDRGIVIVSTRERMMGDVGHKQDSWPSETPGRVAPFLLRAESGATLLRLPLRSIGLPMPISLRAELPSGMEIDIRIQYGVDGIDVDLRERATTPAHNQLSLDL